ncbi:O-acyltransferase WSD1-like [Prunus dulcis]|uniref:O-acyltransferase WSD1-like n=1 Tax=Prunus dulcis TaxID=3755 RepID=UPI001482D3A7|nr:O-acyltransferase WSD1-like [Prunus dulcis]
MPKYWFFGVVLDLSGNTAQTAASKALIDRKKHSLEAAAAYLTANLLTKLLGAKGCGAIAHRVLSNSTFSNLVGPLEEVSFYGHPVAYIAPNVYGYPHGGFLASKSSALTPDAIPDPYKLLDDFEESLKLIRDAVVVEKGLTMEAAV